MKDLNQKELMNNLICLKRYSVHVDYLWKLAIHKFTKAQQISMNLCHTDCVL